MPATMPFHRLLYTSRNAAGLGPQARALAGAIAARSAAANARVGLSGALLLVGDTFIQALEGPYPALDATFERICRDLRHLDLRLVESTPAPDRAFEGWDMGFVAQGARGEPGRAGLDEALDDVRFAVGVSAAEAMAQMRAALLRLGAAAPTEPARGRAAGMR